MLWKNRNNNETKPKNLGIVKKYTFKERKKSKINIAVKIAIPVVVIAIVLVSFILANYKKQNENYQIANSQDFQAATYSDGYKKTSELTNADLADAYQKNYQEESVADGSYLFKSAEWTNKQNGEGLITIKGTQIQELEDTSALYVATMCYYHGLSEDIVVKNIVTLMKFYDKVDFIAINKANEAGIVATKTFTEDSTEEEIRSYVNTTKAAGVDAPHYINSIPPAIEKYLFGNMGDSYISEDKLINNPTAIYVSCDSFYLDDKQSASDVWGVSYATEKYFNFINEYFAGRYFSMSQTSQQSANPVLTIRFGKGKYDANILNIVLGILNPENYGEAELALDDEQLKKWEANTSDNLNLSFTNKKYAADFSYDKDFEEAGVQVITNCTIADTVQDYFEIVDVQATGGSDSMQTRVTGQNILFYDENYVCGNEVIIKIKVKLRDDVISHFDEFEDTNFGKATLSGSVNLSVDSPKLAPITTSYTVNYLEKGTNEVLHIAKTDNNIPINTQIKATDEVIAIDGYNYDSADKATLTLGSGGNVLNLYYTKRTDLSYKVNYLEKDTNKVLSTQKVVKDQTFKAIITSANEVITIYGYNYDSADKDTLTIGTGENVINLYYTKKDSSVLVHHYIENTTERVPSITKGQVVADETVQGKVNDQYKTSGSSNIANNYELVTSKLPANATGVMTEEQIVVTYYYRLKTPTITSQNMTKNGTTTIENLADEITYNISYKVTLVDYIGDAEVTIVDTLAYPIDEAKSDLAGGKYNPTSKTITWVETIIDIDTYENQNNDIAINKTIKVVYTGINQGTTNIKNTVTGKIKTKTPEKEFEETTATTNTTTEFLVNIPVSKIWEDDNNKLGQRPTRVTFKLTGSDGSEYTKELAKSGTSGTTTTQDQTNPNKWNDIFENLPKYDSNNQEIKYTLTEINGNLTYYDVTVDNTGKIVTNTNKYGKVTVHYYIMNTDGTTTTTRVPDANGKEITDVIIEGKEGEEYNTTWANNVNEKYELVAEKLPANATGKIEKYNEEKPQEVIYYYRLKQAKVIINYIEKDTNQVLSPEEQIDGHVDDSYNTNTEYRKETIQKDGRTYTLVEDSGNTEGIINLEGIEVTYYYLQNTKATVRYVARAPETHEIVKELEEPYTQEGLVGDKFVTNEKAFIGYKLVESPTNKTINMTKEEQTLIYYYEPVYTGLIENHIDDKTGRVLYTEEHQVQVGTEYNIPSKEFEGYDLVESKLPANAEGIMGEELVTVNYYYIKKAVLEVNYIDIYTNKPLTDKKVDNTKHEGDLYTTEQKEFENYDLVEVPSNASGTMVVETDEEGNITNNRTVVEYYYTQRAIVEEHHIDSLTGKDIEESKIHNGHVGDEYDIPSKEFLSYQLIEEDEEGNSMLPTNSKGIMTAEKIVVNYYYNQPAKVIVHYVEKATGKELEETNSETGEVQSSQVTIEGFNQDEYTTEAKEFKYYTLIESPENKEGKMKVEIVEDEEGNQVVNNTIDVYYYYQAKPFNIGVEKEITGIVVNGETRTPTNGKLERVEIYRKDVEKTNIQIVYRIRVINSGEVEGAVTIEDKLPEGMNLVNNDGTWEEQDGILRKIIPEINPGETKEYTVVLNWNTAENNMGEKDNVINIVDTQNVPGFIDNNDKDNTSNANVIISVGTGELPIGLILALVALVGLETVTLRYAVVLTKRQKKKVNKK